MDRRTFIKISSLLGGSALVSTGIAGCVTLRTAPTKPVTFTHGVASGDPLSDAIILWTRAVPEQQIPAATVLWEVSQQADFKTLVASGTAAAEQTGDFTVKVDVKGLTPATRYFYRFRTASNLSETGQTLTLPSGNTDSVTFGVFSCSNYPAGFFTPYMAAAEDAKMDYVLHLGDYIYEYGSDGYATENAVKIGRTLAPDNCDEILTLTDYRNRYALYRSDEGLRALHQAKPFIVVWDDHEITNDAYKAGAENHTPDEGDFYTRRAAAVQAYFEWLPIRPPFGDGRLEIYRSFTFGDLVDLYILDSRVIGRDKQLAYADYRNNETGEFDRDAFMRDINNPERSIMGVEQRQWLMEKLSQGNARWQVLAQQLLLARMQFPATIFNGVPREKIAERVHLLANIKRRQLAGDDLSQEQQQLIGTTMPYNLDAWDGYPAEREMLLAALERLDKPVVTLAGDTHNAWFNRLTTQEGKTVAMELGTSSVTAPGMESYLGLDEESAAQMAEDLPLLVDDLAYCNMHQRGFLTVAFTHQQATATWRFVDTILSKDGKVTATHSEVIPA